MADLSQFETAIVNMAVNARDAMNGEGQLTLRLESRKSMPRIRGHAGGPGPFVVVSLSDTGHGIPPDQLSRIFEPFYTTKPVGRGTGLGVSQVFGFAKQSGGDILVESIPGQGSCFQLYLPEVAEPAEPMAPAVSAEAPPAGKGQNVLVVEDNLEVGNFATQILADLGYKTTWAKHADEALACLTAEPGFDVVFSDVVMPGMNGLELAKRIQKTWPSLPVILASGYSDVLVREGTHGFELITKPYSAEQISAAFLRVIRTQSS
jgi:CheY-like chemotaxis protein